MKFETDLQIGTLGEQLFSSWCTEAHLTSNRSLEQDRTGWDHQVEFPYMKTNLPRDRQPSPIECRIQVKATQRRDRRWSIKASVLKRLIDYKYPAFILFLEFSNDKAPVVESAFLLHIDKKIIEKTLKAIRKNDIKQNPKQLHEIKVSLSYNKKHLLSKPSGKAFKNAVLEHVKGGDIEKYIRAKHELVENVGYGQYGYTLSFSASQEEFDKHIIAQSIGRSCDPIEVRNSVFSDNRFDINNGAVEIKRSETAQFIIHPNVLDTCQLRFKPSKYSPSLNFNGELVSSTNIYNLDQDKRFLRTKLFSFEMRELHRDGTIDSEMHLTFDNGAPLDEVLNVFRLFSADNVDKTLLCDVEFKGDKTTLEIDVKINHKFKDARLLVAALSSLKDSYNIDGTLITTPDELYDQREALIGLSYATKNEVDGFQIRFDEHAESYPETIEWPFTSINTIGSYAFGAVLLFHAARTEKNLYQVTRCEVVEPLAFCNEMPTVEQLKQIESDVLESLENKS